MALHCMSLLGKKICGPVSPLRYARSHLFRKKFRKKFIRVVWCESHHARHYFKLYNEVTLIGLAILISGAVVVPIGMMKSIWLVAMSISSTGFWMGILDTAWNVFALQLWNGDEEKSTQSSVLQAIHAGYAIGGMLCIPLARPFLGEYTVGGQDLSDLVNSKDVAKTVDDWVVVHDGKLNILFSIVGVVIILISLLFFIEFKLSNRPFRQEKSVINENGTSSKSLLIKYRNI